MSDRPVYGPDSLPWEDCPSTAQPTLIPIYAANPQASTLVVSLSDKIAGIYTHYYLKRTIPCLGKDNGCICSDLLISRRWKGYLAAYDTFCERYCLAEITMEAYRLCPVLHKQAGLAKRTVKLFKSGKKKESPGRVEVLGIYDGPLLLPPCFDVRDALCRIWMGLTRSSDEE